MRIIITGSRGYIGTKLCQIIKQKYQNIKITGIDVNYYDFKILISDWSGIFLEYSLITKRKTILINTNQKINNERVNLNFPISVEEHSRKYLSNNIDKDEIEKIPELIKNNTFDKEDLVVKTYLKKYFY